MTNARRMCVLAVWLAQGCALYTGASSTGSGTGSGDSGSGGSTPGYVLTLDHSVAAELDVAGVDADQQGGLWIAYAGDTDCAAYGPVTLVHWDPTTQTRLTTYTYTDDLGAAAGLAIVNGQIWLNRTHPCGALGEIQIIDPASGNVVGSASPSESTDDLAAVDTAHVLYSDSYNMVYTVDTSTYGFVSSFATDPSTRLQGIAWRPGEIRVSSWGGHSASVFDPSGQLLGVATFPSVVGVPQADNVPAQLAFDRGQLLVAVDSELYWLDVSGR